MHHINPYQDCLDWQTCFATDSYKIEIGLDWLSNDTGETPGVSERFSSDLQV